MKKSWDSLYENELSNHASNPQDEGTVWFDDADAERKMVEFLDERATTTTGEPTTGTGTGTGTALNRSTAAVLDLGCGNGSLLFALRDDGWAGRLLGVDYSERSVQLARAVGVSRRGGGDCDQEEEEEEGGDGDENARERENEKEREVDFKTWDVLNGPLDDVRAATIEGDAAAAAGWDLVLDKGTFDAISLSGERDGQGRRICEGYGARVLQLLRTGGLFLVTSCNWTEAELREWFGGKTWAEAGTETGARLRLAGRIAYPVFSFGGVKGQTISTLCFEKVV